MEFKTLDDFDFDDKKVLLRVDINSPVIDEEVKISERIKEAAKTIHELKKKNARVIVIAHQSSPGKKDYTSLEQHDRLLNKLTKVKFVDSVVSERSKIKIKGLKKGEAILLENVRSLKDELKPMKKKNEIVEKLLPLADIFINDAFSICHRKQTSIVSFAEKLPSGIGRTMEKELEALKRIDLDNCLYILSGAKPKDNLKLVGKNKILACGLFGQCCVIARGINLGGQNEYLKENIDEYEEVIGELKQNLDNIVMPEDFALDIEGKRKELKLNEFPSKYEIFDIGEKTQEKFVEKIKSAKSIYVKGPAGYCESEKFSKGTLRLLKAIGQNEGFSLIGGGHISEVIEKYNVDKKQFSHISLAGGALLNYIAGEELPGIEALKINGLKNQ